MKITFSLLVRWLRAYQPVTTIYQQDLECEGVRFYTEGNNLNPNYLYISKSDRFLANSDPREVLLIQNNNIIRLLTDDMEQIYNEVIEGFEYYSDLKYRLQMAVNSDCFEQEIADICSELFGPTFVIDKTYHFLGISSKYQTEDKINDVWDEFVKSKGASLLHLRRFADDYLFQNIHRKIINYVHVQPAAEPYIYTAICSYCDKKGNVLGQCAISQKQKITEEDLDLLHWIIVALESRKHIENRVQGNQYAQLILQTALERKELLERDVEILYSMQRWNTSTWLCLGILDFNTDNNAKDSLQMYFATKIVRMLPGTIVVQHEKLLVFCFPLNEKQITGVYQYIQEKLNALLALKKCTLGISLPFYSFSNIHFYYTQAVKALQSDCSDFYTIAVEEILAVGSLEFSKHALHPAIKLLEEYDKKYNGELCVTLQTFLRLNQSYAAVADMLHIHRNTVLYRLDKIRGIYPLNLRDPDTVEYLLLSLRMLSIVRKQEQKSLFVKKDKI